MRSYLGKTSQHNKSLQWRIRTTVHHIRKSFTWVMMWVTRDFVGCSTTADFFWVCSRQGLDEALQVTIPIGALQSHLEENISPPIWLLNNVDDFKSGIYFSSVGKELWRGYSLWSMMCVTGRATLPWVFWPKFKLRQKWMASGIWCCRCLISSFSTVTCIYDG